MPVILAPKASFLIMLCLVMQSAFAAELYNNTALLMEAHIAAKAAGIAPKGKVTVLDRRGFWVNIQAGQLQGWTQLSKLKMEEEIQWMPSIDVLHDTGRLMPNSK